ncbi:aldo/keto reductase, partial [uncultured Muribaculum sp.]
YMTGLKAAKELKEALGTDNLAEAALRYILMYPEVSTVIPGASSPQQIVDNARSTQLPPFTIEQMAIVRDIYNRYIREQVHDKW